MKDILSNVKSAAAATWRWIRGTSSTSKAPAYLPRKGRTKHSGEHLTDEEMQDMMNLQCPDCLNKSLLVGPSGGICQNLHCSTDHCGSRFNAMGPFGVERISDARPNKRTVMLLTPYRG